MSLSNTTQPSFTAILSQKYRTLEKTNMLQHPFNWNLGASLLHNSIFYSMLGAKIDNTN